MKIAMIKGTKMTAHIAEDANNLHILEVGPSGSGKSVAGAMLAVNAALEGAAVIGISMNHAITIPSGQVDLRIVHAKKEGVPLPVFSCIQEAEELDNSLDNAVDAFCAVSRLRVRQKKALRDALIRAFKSDLWTRNEFAAIAMELIKSKDEIGESVYDHYEQMFRNARIYEEKSLDFGKPGRILIFDLSGYSDAVQSQLAQYILIRVWQEARAVNRVNKNRWFFHLDEFQNFGLRPDSTLYQIIREGRKFGVGTIMATQNLECFSRPERALLLQASTKLFFKPEPQEVNRLMRDIGRPGEEALSKRLRCLKRGESMAIGRFAVENKNIEHPITLDFNEEGRR